MTRRVLIAGFKHETNTFSKLPTDLAAYRARALHRGAEVPGAYRDTRTEIAAFIDACERHGWTPVYGPAGDATPSGPVTREAFETLTDEIIAAAQSEAVSAMLLQLHGAMVAEHADDGEGALLEAIRARFGRTLPIAVTLDLHANVTDKMADLADIIVSYRTYPHTDMYETGTRAADLLARQLDGAVRPRVTVRRGAMLDAVDHGRTTAPGPMTEMLARAAAFEAEPGILSISINAGFPWADIADAGPSVVVVADGEEAAARAADIAQTLIDEIWQTRHRKSIETLDVETALARLATVAPGPGPVVLADYADNPGGGGYGDSPRLLGGLIAAGIENAAFATMYDPEAAAICHRAGEGAEVSLALGGKMDPAFGAPLEVCGTVQRLTDGRLTFDGPMAKGVHIDMGPSAVLRVGGIDTVIASGRFQVYDQQFFRHAGIDPASRAVLGVKSAHHFRAAFGPIARASLVVDSGAGLTSANFKALPFRKVRRPIYPLDLD
ncbi:MAG: M81 family peptidase [Alphaproteobacteria bacterium]|nr:MAG: M81 family peptidase [Alphaproteobacteria bacterium]